MEWLNVRVILVFVAIASLIAWFIRRSTRRGPSNLPPGLTNWPIIGSIPGIVHEYFQSGRPGPHELLANLAAKYGKLYTVSLGSLRVVVANDYYTVKEAGQNHLTAARPPQIGDTIGGEGRRHECILGLIGIFSSGLDDIFSPSMSISISISISK